MTTKDTRRFTASSDTVFEPGDVDLDRERYTWPDGSPLTEKSAEEYTVRRATAGRPSLDGRRGISPSVAFRVSPELRREADTLAAREGRTVSEIARQALADYVARHRRPA